MKQVFLKKGAAVIHEIPAPLLSPNTLLVQVHYSFISTGTEFATITASGTSLLQKATSNTKKSLDKVMGAIKDNGLSGTYALIQEKMHQYMPIGYSCTGQVIAIGANITNFRIGDYVACAGAQFANHANIVSVPENLVVKIVNQDFLKQTSLTTIGAIALQGVRRANLQLGESVCVIGLGLIGQLTVQLAKLSGSTIFGIDLVPSRLDLAREFGAQYTYNPAQENLYKEIDFATGHKGVDTTIITAASASGEILQQAMNITRRKGKVILVGDVKLDFDRDAFYAKEIDLLISCSYGPGRYDQSYELEGHDYPYAYVRWTENRNMQFFASLVQEKKISIDKLIDHEFSVTNAEKAYEQLQSKQSLGIVLAYEQEPIRFISEVSQKTSSKSYTPYKAPQNTLNIACVGVGGFAKTTLLPIITNIKNSKLVSIIDPNSSLGLTLSDVYKTSYHNDYRTVCDNPDIHAVVIATPHYLHTEQALACLHSGKAVFVEKPAAVTFEQLEQLKTFFKNNTQSLYCADFNRSSAPIITKIKSVISKRNNPMMVTYRMNAGFLPLDHWTQSAQNRGRIIGEACHIFELFCFLTDAQPLSISVSALNPIQKSLTPTDNISVQLSMADGSSCTLLYTALGDSNAGKERMEIFFDGKTIVMQDYKELTGYGLPASFNTKSKNSDKGHKILLTQFFTQAQSQNFIAPIPISRILLATEISLIVDKLARSGGGLEKFI